MKKMMILVISVVLITVMGLAVSNVEKEPIETDNKTTEKTENHELAEEFSYETVFLDDIEETVNKPEKVAVSEEKVVKTHQNTTTNSEVKPTTNTDAKESEVTEKLQIKPDKEEEKIEVIETPKHTHTWEPIHSNRKIEKIKIIPWTKCYACGADMTGNVNHIDEHLLNGDSNVHYGTEYREEMYYETEEYISGYKCSCGEIK